MEVSGQLHELTALPPKERATGTHWIGDWVGCRAGLDTVVKSSQPLTGLEPPIIQPVAQWYTTELTRPLYSIIYVILTRKHAELEL
jgi:hypothetical protein